MLGQARWLNDELAFPFVRGARPDAPGFRDVHVTPEVIVGLVDRLRREAQALRARDRGESSASRLEGDLRIVVRASARLMHCRGP
jgi:hypothetical protein